MSDQTGCPDSSEGKDSPQSVDVGKEKTGPEPQTKPSLFLAELIEPEDPYPTIPLGDRRGYRKLGD